MQFLSQIGLKYLKISRNLIFILKFSAVFYLAYYINLKNQNAAVDLSSGKNLLHYVLKLLTFYSRFLSLVVFCAEDFFRHKNHKKVHLESLKIKEILHREFLYEINDKNFKKVLRRRVILVVLQTCFHEFTYLFLNISKFSKTVALTFVTRFGRTFLNCCMIYRFCRYVDLINLHLMALIEVVSSKFIENSNNENIAIKRILAIRKCYIHILNMQEQFMLVEKWTSLIHFVVMMLSITRRVYRMFMVIVGALPLREALCELKRIKI